MEDSAETLQSNRLRPPQGFLAAFAQAQGDAASFLQNTAPDVMIAEEEQKLLNACALLQQQAEEASPDWAAYYEDVQPCSAPKADILELLRCAPTPFAKGLMYGIYLMRYELSLMTGREFL